MQPEPETCLCTLKVIQQSEIIILDQTEETMCLHRSKPVGHIARHTAGCRSNRCWAQASDLD